MKRSKSLEIKKSVINRDESTLEFFSKLKNADIHKNQNFNDILFMPHISRSIKLPKFVFNFIPLPAFNF